MVSDDESRSKGPPVWRDMDQRELDDAYDQAVWAPNREQVLRRWVLNSERARGILAQPERISYGPSEIEQVDIYRAPRTDGRATNTDGATRTEVPVQIFIHGGAWRATQAADYALPAETFVRAGAHLVVLDFAPVTDLDGDLSAMFAQVRRAVAWVHRNARSFGGDPDRIYLSGHSSGAHLAGCLVTGAWSVVDLPADIVKGALLISGMYELEPVSLSKRSAYVRFTETIVSELSPIRHLDRLVAPLVVAYGTRETPEFQRHSRELVEAVQAAGKPATLLVAEEYNHFEILETLASPYGLLGRAALAQMGLGPT